MYELFDTLDNRTIRVFPTRKALNLWLSHAGHWWLSAGYSYRRCWGV